MVRFEKDIDGKHYVVVAVPDSEYKKIWVVTEYKQKKDASQEGHGDNAPSLTSETNLDTASEKIVSHEKKSVKDSEYLELAKDTVKNESKLRAMVEVTAKLVPQFIMLQKKYA